MAHQESTKERLDRDFQKWIEAHPWILQMFMAIAHEQLEDSSHIVARFAWELLRRRMRRVDGGPYLLNNNYQSRLVRLAMSVDPDLAGKFEIRGLAD
jgi:hypothetical protein